MAATLRLAHAWHHVATWGCSAAICGSTAREAAAIYGSTAREAAAVDGKSVGGRDFELWHLLPMLRAWIVRQERILRLFCNGVEDIWKREEKTGCLSASSVVDAWKRAGACSAVLNPAIVG